MMNLNIKKSKFCEYFIQINKLNNQNFNKWIFYNGMLFNHANKWWVKNDKRVYPHEGIDLCAFKNKKKEIIWLKQHNLIPSFYEGIIIDIIDDFLGKTIFIMHNNYKMNHKYLYTILGHTTPLSSIKKNKEIISGEILGYIADTSILKNKLKSHLHISVAMIPETFNSSMLSWEIINNHNMIDLYNPLDFMDCIFDIKC